MSGGVSRNVDCSGSGKQVYDSEVYDNEDKASYVSSVLPVGEETDDEPEQLIERSECEANSNCCNVF